MFPIEVLIVSLSELGVRGFGIHTTTGAVTCVDSCSHGECSEDGSRLPRPLPMIHGGSWCESNKWWSGLTVGRTLSRQSSRG